VVGVGQHGLAAMGLHHVGDFQRVGGDRNAPDPGLFRPAQHVDDHRQAGDVQKRLAGQTSGRHAGGNEHQGAVFGHPGKLRGRSILGRK